ncbi:MAG TPA: hypothetical protein VIV14_08345 [Gammaproteobacteria bacterium]
MRPLSCALILEFVAASLAIAQTSSPDITGVYMPAAFVDTPTIVGPDVYPLTAAGQARVADFSEFNEPNQADDCAPERVPNVFWHGAAMQISENGGNLIFHYERGNTTRTVFMNRGPAPASHPPSLVGFSTGAWDGETLVIETTHLAGGSLRNNRAQPLSAEARLTERYRREPGSDVLRLELTVEDPVYYTEPFTLSRELIYSSDDSLQDWVCVSLGPRDKEELDLDELARMLEGL